MARLIGIFRKYLWKVVLVWGVVWAVASFLAPKVFEFVLPKIQERTRSMGVVIDGVDYSKIKVSPWLRSVSAENVAVNFDLKPNDRHRLSSTFRCDEITVSLTNPFTMRGSIKMHGFEVQFHKSDIPKELPFDRFSDGEVFLASVPLIKPREAVRELFSNVVALFQHNQTKGGFKFSGKVFVKVGAKDIPTRIYSERLGKEFRLRFSEDDVRNVAKAMRIHLSDDQVKMVSLYPLRVPIIAMITERARKISVQYYNGDHWKQDALRHTLWSFMLTEAFGPEFALEVTDAQETKPGNEHFERLMDYNNNAVGRAFAKEKVKLQDIPRLVLEDPRVVLNPDDAKFRPKGQLLK